MDPGERRFNEGKNKKQKKSHGKSPGVPIAIYEKRKESRFHSDVPPHRVPPFTQLLLALQAPRPNPAWFLPGSL